MTRLAERLMPCGPVIDARAAERTREILTEKLDGAPTLETAWPALAPVFGASPYLSGLARRRPKALLQTLESDPDARLAGILADAEAVGAEPDSDEGRKRLRELKADLHLLTALADLGGVWDLDQVTGALARFADAALPCTLR
eukprot:Opistho-1_new@30550